MSFCSSSKLEHGKEQNQFGKRYCPLTRELLSHSCFWSDSDRTTPGQQLECLRGERKQQVCIADQGLSPLLTKRRGRCGHQSLAGEGPAAGAWGY